MALKNSKMKDAPRGVLFEFNACECWGNIGALLYSGVSRDSPLVGVFTYFCDSWFSMRIIFYHISETNV